MLYWDSIGENGKENGNYHSILGLYWGYIGILEKNMETVGLISKVLPILSHSASQ